MKDAKTEHYLTARGYTWQYVKDFPIARLDLKEAESNPARLGKALDEEYALSIGLAVQDGAELPAIVTHDTGDGLDDIITGRHRVSGVTTFCKPRRDTIDAYRVREADKFRVDLLVRTINTIEGHAPGTHERLIHVAEMRRKYPHTTTKDIAKEFGVAVETAHEYLRVLAMERRAEELGVGHIVRNNRGFSMKLKSALNSINIDSVFVHAVDMVAKHPNDFKGSAGSTLAKELRSLGSERRMLKFVETRDRELTEVDDQRKAKKSRSPTGRATLFVGAARSLLKKYPGSPDKLYLEGLGSTCDQLRRELKVLREARDALDDVEGAVEKLLADLERQEEWQQKARPGNQSSEGTSPA